MASSSQQKSSTTKKQVPAKADTEPAIATRQSLSYHTIQTFPENSYAFINLPKDQADKLKKRLNGSVFRGVKVRVEEARPETWATHPEPEGNMEDVESAKSARKEEKKEKRKRSKAEGEPKVKKRKKGEDGILQGIELPEGRKVQRGWTKPAVPTGVSAKYAGRASSSAKKIEDESKRECLFKTPLPPNKATPKDKQKKDKEEKKDKKKRKREVVIKEFKNNTKFPQFLRASQLDKDQAAEKMASEYVEGVGWVNAKGDVVEEEKVKKRADGIMQTEVQVLEPADAPKGVDVTDASESDDDEVMVDAATMVPTEAKVGGEDDSSSESESEPQIPGKKSQTTTTSKSDSSSSESSRSGSNEEEATEKTSPITPVTPVSPTKPLRSSSTTSPKTTAPALQITIPTVTNPPSRQSIHLKLSTNPPLKIPPYSKSALPHPPLPQLLKVLLLSSALAPTTIRTKRRDQLSRPPSVIATAPPRPRQTRQLDIANSSQMKMMVWVMGESLGSSRLPRGLSEVSLVDKICSRFLGALSVWSKIPTPKILTEAEEELVEEVPVEEEGEGQPKKKDRKKKAKAVEEIEEAAPGDKTMADVWSEKFYENRGEWNRAWKQRRRESIKQKKKKEAAGNPSVKRITA
ncbi:uncharacterized protein LAJ45_10664 [Morchella importuna]|uniref:uncharacterized protein n=1 Tax=Morchella importuna TaxID=1174673 RepID=UPI001E8E1815|nr:uncharacterized protein LAJ45_10664 [Morchella importuna]KAH8145381.1 hypothetical protein LAJ45_10664 [Morchella importuna]